MVFPRCHRAVFALLLLALPVAVVRGQVPSGFTVDPASREQVRVLFNTVYQASANVPSGWTGDVPAGDAGTTSPAFRDAVDLRVNYYRAMGGVPATITFSDALNAADQLAALMMSANRSLSHDPPSGWADYTDAGAEAARASNLALGTTEDGPAAIDGYVAENGGNNDAVGHRRWLLYPPQTTMGTGDVDGSGDDAIPGANALWVLDTASFADPAPAARDGFVAWPPPGFVPYPLVSARWSFTLPDADFGAATVSMTREGVAVPVRLLALDPGYGDNTLVWVPDGLDPADPPAPAAPAMETDAVVTVDNVLVGGVARSFTYTVTPFDPATPGADTVVPVISGPAQIIVGPPGAYTFNDVPGATGYRWRATAMSPLALDLDAEDGPGDVTILPAGTDLITTDQAANGAACYQFASVPAETLTLNAAFVPAAGSMVTFNSQLDYASADETARVQISTDDGLSWADLYTLSGAGTDGPTETEFAAHTLDLGAYAGQHCTLRFAYAAGGAGVYYPRAGQTGWFVDDVTLEGVQSTAEPVTGDVAAGERSFTFAPGTGGSYALQVVPVFFGQYTADDGPMFAVSAVEAGGAAGPLVTVAATVPQTQAAGGANGEFTVTRAGDDLSQKIVVHYVLKGSAVSGVDYAPLSGKVKLKPGHASKTVEIVPLPGGGLGKVKLVLEEGDDFILGTPSRAKVKIVP